MIPPNQELLVLESQSLDLSQVMTGNSTIPGQRDRIKPILAFAGGCPNMNVSRLGGLVRIKVEAKLADPQDRWHNSILPQKGGQSIPPADRYRGFGVANRLI
jgi:hypothetical protein